MTPRESAGPGPATIAPGLVELLSGDDVVAIAPALLGAKGWQQTSCAGLNAFPAGAFSA